ncbi:hypothetical protein GIB67_007657 [Kingdonia uniflora]|uniref:Uncharacterized protein n=1 Tax=Kingdonia uniflora TaxID=39325 RepID=A0A7J7N1K1_9MAGN|nr:hypothetical protein GIB67_007657 [Kingdonia uniflora]
MPLGTIVRLARKQKQPCVMGCMENLYHLENFDSALLVKESVKEMLFCPKNLAGALCSKLKISIDDREPVKCECGGSTNTEILLDDGNVNEGVFIEGPTFIVSDDLQIKPIGTNPIFTYLNDLGIRGTDAHALEEKTITVGVDESKNVTQTPRSEDITQSSKSEDTENLDTEMFIKITVVKSNNKVLYAEAGNVECPVLSRHVTPTNKTLLLSPMVNPRFDCNNECVHFEMFQLKYYCKSWNNGESRDGYFILTVNASLTTSNWETGEILKPIDADRPSPPCEFVKGPATFMITDDLVIIPFSFISCISLIEKENISMGNVDAQVVSIGRKEVLILLEAALTSKNALTAAFINSGNTEFKKPKQEI